MIPSIETMENAFNIKGKNIMITGGNRGIGKGIATAMAQSGANIAILARDEASSLLTIEELSAYGGKPPLVFLRRVKNGNREESCF